MLRKVVVGLALMAAACNGVEGVVERGSTTGGGGGGRGQGASDGGAEVPSSTIDGADASTPDPNAPPESTAADGGHVTARQNDPNTSFLIAVYYDVLARAPDVAGEQAWTAKLTSGTSRTDVAKAIVDSSEARQDDVNAIYKAYLLRPADPSGLTYWTPMTDRNVRVGVVASSEYYGRAGNTAQFIRNVYHDVLEREAADSEVAAWEANYPGNAQFAADVVDSPEHHTRQVADLYVKLLGRAGASQELAFWANQMNQGTLIDTIEAGILGSEEYFTRAGTRYP